MDLKDVFQISGLGDGWKGSQRNESKKKKPKNNYFPMVQRKKQPKAIVMYSIQILLSTARDTNSFYKC